MLWWSPKSRQCLLWPESRGLKPADPMRFFYSKAQGTGTGERNLGISAEQRERYSTNPGSFPSASVRVSRDADRYSEHPGGQPAQRSYRWPWTSLDRFPGFLLDSAVIDKHAGRALHAPRRTPGMTSWSPECFGWEQSHLLATSFSCAFSHTLMSTRSKLWRVLTSVCERRPYP